MSRMTLTALSLLAVAFVAGGCQTDQKSVAEVPAPRTADPITASQDPTLAGASDPLLSDAGAVPPIGNNDPAGSPGSFTLGEANTGPTFNAGATAGADSYTVRRGDTLWSIARSHYGSGQRWKDIVAANPGLVPEKMAVGQVINLP